MCTNIGATGASVLGGSKVYFGSVSDDPYDIRTRVIVEREAGGYAFVGTDLVPLGGRRLGGGLQGFGERRADPRAQREGARLHLGARLRAAGEHAARRRAQAARSLAPRHAGGGDA